jgi:hypothetical protein
MSENEKFIQGSWFYFDTRGSLLNYDNVKIPITIDRQNDTISPYGGGPSSGLPQSFPKPFFNELKGNSLHFPRTP